MLCSFSVPVTLLHWQITIPFKNLQSSTKEEILLVCSIKKYKEKFLMLQSIGIIVITRETSAVIYTSRCSIDCKIKKFSLYLLVYCFGNNFNIGELTSTTSKERMTANIIFRWL